uniref:ELWxxDGT repeat protein n=1 Tax=Candidatus Limnocylindrus sp. TaxID=2802978 RepID=UPI004049DEC7
TALGGFLYFRADNGTTGTELWRTDGTEAGTTSVKDINPGASSSYPPIPHRTRRLPLLQR